MVRHETGLQRRPFAVETFLLCFAPRRVSFLAKSPLFRMPVIGSLVRALDSIPVYRRQDEGADTSRNRETFGRSAALLRRGGTLAICPEGASHSEPYLLPLKTGAARIALGAASASAERDEDDKRGQGKGKGGKDKSPSPLPLPLCLFPFP